MKRWKGNMIEFLYVNDDWEELWIEGEVACAGHRLSSSEILRALCKYATGNEPIIRQIYRCDCGEDLGEDWGEGNFICLDCSKEKLQ